MPKTLVSTVISAFLDHLRPNFFLPTNYGGQHRAFPLFKISGSVPVLATSPTHSTEVKQTSIIVIHKTFFLSEKKLSLAENFRKKRLSCFE